MGINYLFRSLFLVAFFLVIITNNYGQINVHHSDFNVSQGEIFTISGPIGDTPWQVNRSGDDWGARIHNDILELTNTAGFGDNANGWVCAFLETDDFDPPYNTILGDNIETITWYFNMRQIRDNPAGFGSNTYGVAFVIGSTSNDVATEGEGYAIVLGNASTPDPARFVYFTEGIQSLGTTPGGLIVAGEPLDDPTNDHMSLKLTYDPATNEWELFGRNDGDSFQDPQSGELSFLGNVNNDDYTDIELEYMGAYWQGSTAADQTAFFDNVSVWVDDTGPAPPSISNIIQDPDSDITPETTVSVSADVTPGDAPIEIVELEWGVSEHNLENTIPMIVANGNTYTTETDIPAQEHNTTVYYQVYAEDQDGESATSDLYSYQVLDPSLVLIIVEVINPEPITVGLGTLFEDLPLPSTVEVILDNEETETLEVEWQEGDYDPYTPDIYILLGELVLTEGIYNPDDLKAEIEVTVVEPVLVVAWTFPEETQEADQGIPENIGKLITREPGFDGSYSYGSGVDNYAIRTLSWDEGADTKYWVVEFSTLNYGDLSLSSAQRSSNTGPRDFKVQYRIGTTGDWNDVENSDITVADDFTTGVLEKIELPEICNNKSSLHLRWIMTSNTSVAGETVGGQGASRIDMIKIEGYYSEDFTLMVIGIDDPEDITVEAGTLFEDLPLPDEVNVHYDDQTSEYLPVNWEEGNYDGNQLGTYTLEGEIELPQGVENPDNLKAYINVKVVEYFEVTFNLDMSDAPEFNPDNDDLYITGTMFDGAPPGELHDEQVMEPAGNMIYTNTMQLPEGKYEYNYYINEGWNNPESDEPREVEIVRDTIFNDAWGATTINQWMKTTIKIYPNPATNYIYISSDYKMKFVELINMKGQVVSRNSVENDFCTLQLTGMVDGIYFLRITTTKAIHSQRIIIGK